MLLWFPRMTDQESWENIQEESFQYLFIDEGPETHAD